MSPQELRLSKVWLATMVAYSLMPADWLVIAIKTVEQLSPKSGGLETWLKQLESKRGVHLFAQLAYGTMHRDTYDGALLMLDAVIRLGKRKRSDPRDDRAFQDCVAPYYLPEEMPDDEAAMQERIHRHWSGKVVPELLTDEGHRQGAQAQSEGAP